MGGLVSSVGGLVGLGKGDQSRAGQFGNGGLAQLNEQNGVNGSQFLANRLNDYAQGNLSSSDVLNTATRNYGSGDLTGSERTGLMNALATGATTGSKFAREQVMGDPTQAGLYGQNGQLGNAEGRLSSLENQGYQLTPDDNTLYGQASGQIARNYGQQGNQMAQSLASRGLSNSGAAGAQFSGLAGNQNEMLAQAQQNIMQQRFQNTLGQIGQQQNFIGQLGGQYGNALQQQYGRQLAGAQNQTGQLAQAAGAQSGQNNSQNQYNMQAQNFEEQNKPMNAVDMVAGAFTGKNGMSVLGMGGGKGQTGGGDTSGGGGGGTGNASKAGSLFG